MALELATRSTSDVLELWNEALHHVAKKRGGPQLIETIRGDVSDDAMLDHLIAQGAFHLETDNSSIVGFAIVRQRVIEALYVRTDHRRRGCARSMVNSLRRLDTAPIDALALPGDRAMKSLYESFGWKARLLTMHVA